MSDFFNLYSNCITVKGINRSIIVDLQKNNFIYINNDLFDVLTKLKSCDVNSVYLEYGAGNKETLDEYFAYISDFGFYCSEEQKKNFSSINLSHEIPCKISNSIIENNFDAKLILQICNDLALLQCSTIDLVYYDEVSNKFITDLLLDLNENSIKQINLTLKNDEYKTLAFLEELCNLNARIHKIVIHSSQTENRVKLNNIFNIYFIKRTINDFSSCGQINIDYLTANLLHFTESINHNSCLHKKIAIDRNGNIKNCPGMMESFGNIKDTTLEKALNHSNFKKYWNITKDQIEVCKDCEFRHICTDCRAFVEKPDDQYSKPLKCGYNPYTNEWSEWSTNPLKEKAIEHYGMQDLVKTE